MKMPFYYGWSITGMAMLVYALLIGTTHSAFGLYVLPVSTELGLSRADMNTALILLSVGCAVVSPLVGRMLDRFSIRKMMMGCALLYGSCMIGLGLSKSTLLSAAVILVPLSIAVQGCGVLTMTVLVARWFVKRRGRALALSLIGTSLGGIVVVPAMAWLIDAQGWRMTLILTGAVVGPLLIGIALMARDRPTAQELEQADEEIAQPAAVSGKPQAPKAIGALLAAPNFWTIGIGCALAMGCMGALSASLVPLGLDRQLSLMQATSLISAMAAGSIAGKLVLAVFADRVDRIVLLTLQILLLAATFIALVAATSYWAMLPCAVMLGLVMGGLPPVYYALLAEQFGIASFGTVRGLMAPLTAAAVAIAIRFAGEVYDRTGNYDFLFYSLCVALLLAAASLMATRLVNRLPRLAGT